MGSWQPPRSESQPAANGAGMLAGTGDSPSWQHLEQLRVLGAKLRTISGLGVHVAAVETLKACMLRGSTYHLSRRGFKVLGLSSCRIVTCSPQ